MAWSGGLIEWFEEERAYISVVFSWQREEAYQRALWLKVHGYEVWIGGPAVYSDPHFFRDMAAITPSPTKSMVWRHNQDATFTTRGCVRKCAFCIVPKIEPEYEELSVWDIRPIVCDNNILASSDAHFNRVIDRLKPLKNVDFNQGLDVRLMTKFHAERLQELDMNVVRLAWDSLKLEKQWMRAFERLRSAGFPAKKIRTYVLIGFNDTPEEALYKLETVKALGALPNPMRYQPLDAPERNSYVDINWTDKKLKRYMKYWSRQIWYGHIPFEEWGVCDAT